MKIKYITLVCCVILFYFISCVKNTDYVINDGLNVNDIIRISSISPMTASADSSTQITIRVSINSKTDSAENVTLTTSSGTVNGISKSESMSVNVNKYADFVLKTGQISGPLLLRASVLGSYFRDTILTLSIAYPDTIIVQPDNYIVTAGASSNAKINFIRYQGFPSRDQTIFLSSLDSSGNVMGQFTTTDSFNPGSPLNAVFTPLAGYTGRATLLAILIRKDGTRITGQTNVNIQ